MRFGVVVGVDVDLEGAAHGLDEVFGQIALVDREVLLRGRMTEGALDLEDLAHGRFRK